MGIQFLHLQQDYEYNLELLDGRDAELERYDKEFDSIRRELAARDHLVSQLRTALAKAESGAATKLPHHSDSVSSWCNITLNDVYCCIPQLRLSTVGGTEVVADHFTTIASAYSITAIKFCCSH